MNISKSALAGMNRYAPRPDSVNHNPAPARPGRQPWSGGALILAKALHAQVDIISSLAGRVPEPALPVGSVGVGGFGWVDGLRRWLREEHIDAVVDATHPFAARIIAHAAEACSELGLPIWSWPAPHGIPARPPS